MTGLRVIMFVVGLLIATPFIALNVWGLQMTLWVDEVTAQNEAVLNGNAEDVIIPPMPETPPSWIRGRAEVRDTFSTEAINARRLINIEEIVAFEDLLTTDEDMPDEELHALYATARAPARLMAYCTDVLATVGTTCDIVYSSVRLNRTGKYELTGRLGFVPRAEFGDPSAVQNGEIVTARVPLPYEGNVGPANDATTRQAILLQAQALCDTLRAQLGNCVLANVTLDVRELWITDLEALPAGTNPQRLEATVGFAVYADETALNRRSFQDMLDQMVNPS
ncbi:hypothetical protein [Loktanella sp. Alg231-35]|uniref:hypothetical protein n=1 Tax=Loktanella sp. Alg231-35 TaxID=1922220 RepID=UPI000D55AA8C|nr:hypothetical protein [Loktanella sp. Alg231-35]